MRWLDGITDSMDMNLSRLWEMVKDRKSGVLQSMGSQRVGHDLGIKQLQQQQQCGIFKIPESLTTDTVKDRLTLTHHCCEYEADIFNLID